MVTRGNGRPDWRSPPSEFVVVPLRRETTWLCFNVKNAVQLEQGNERLETVPRWRHICPRLELGGKVDAVRAAGGRAADRAAGNRQGGTTSLAHRDEQAVAAVWSPPGQEPESWRKGGPGEVAHAVAAS